MAKGYTVKMGPWLPDLQNVGVEMPFQWTETELPVADCLNVYYQDAAYRCLPAPASFGPSLGTQILDAFTWYDNTQGKEIVFAATANGFSQLEDGAWTQIPLQVNASAGTVGLAISLALGSPFACAVWVTPTSQSDLGNTATYTFGTVTANCGNGTPSAYSWSFSGTTGPGSWSISSGGGTANVVPTVSGSTGGNTSTANINCQFTVNGNTYTASASLSYQEVSAQTFTYTNQAGTTLTIPSGYTSMQIQVSASGGAGGAGYGTTDDSWGGGGGGAGGYCTKTFAITSANWGQTLDIGATNTSSAVSVSSGTYSLTSLTAQPGTAGGAASSGHGGTAGTGGTATGGTTNTTGANGTAGSLNNGGPGGAATNGYGAGGTGALQSGFPAGGGGYAGIVVKFT